MDESLELIEALNALYEKINYPCVFLRFGYNAIEGKHQFAVAVPHSNSICSVPGTYADTPIESVRLALGRWEKLNLSGFLRI